MDGPHPHFSFIALLTRIYETLIHVWPYTLIVVTMLVAAGACFAFSARFDPSGQTESPSSAPGRGRSRSTRASASTRPTAERSLRRLDPARYTVFSDLYIPRHRGEGTTHLDHVVVSVYGVFVIHTVQGNGKIDPAGGREWIRKTWLRSRRFVNPVSRNAFHAKALAHFLGIKNTRCHPITLFTGSVVFETPPPAGVLAGRLARTIMARRKKALSAKETKACKAMLTQLHESGDQTVARMNYLASKSHSFAPLVP